MKTIGIIIIVIGLLVCVAVGCMKTGIVELDEHKNVFTGETTGVTVSVNTKDAEAMAKDTVGGMIDWTKSKIESL